MRRFQHHAAPSRLVGLALLAAAAIACGGDPSVTGQREPFRQSSDATLKSLALSDGELNYPFNPHDWIYRATVAHDVAELTVKATASHRAATVTVGGAALERGAASEPIALAVGPTEITIAVTAEDGSTADYLLAVVRGRSNDATLAALAVDQATLNGPFDPATLAYTASVGPAIATVAITATATGAAEGAAVVLLGPDGAACDPESVPLSDGSNTIEILVIAADEVTAQTYTLTVTRQSTVQDNADLAALAIEGVAMSPAFDPADSSQAGFQAEVSGSTSTVCLTATPASAAATVVVTANDTPVADLCQLPLLEGDNDIAITVTAGDGITVRVYSIAVTRPVAGTNASLAGLKVTTGTNGTERPLYQGGFNPGAPGFDPAVTSYAAVIWGFTQVTVTATAADPEVAALTIDGAGQPDSGVLAQTLDLTPGAVRSVEVVVIAGDGTTTETTTVLLRVLNIFEFYYGIYAPVQRASKAEWLARVDNNPDLGLDEQFQGAEHGTMHWTITLAGLQGRNRMDFDRYNNGNQGFPYVDRGWSETGRLESIVSLAGNGTQTGDLELASHQDWGDLVAGISYNLTLQNKQTVAGPNSYTDCEYLGETVRFFYAEPSPHASLADEWDPYTPWTAADFE